MTAKIIKIGIFLLLLSICVTSQYFYDQNKQKTKVPEPLVLDAKTVRIVDFGLHNAAADFAWLGAVQYFGGSSQSNYDKIDEYLNLATDLDPKFAYPYAFGTLIMPSLNMTEQAINLAKKGIERSSSDWRIPFYLGTIYHLNKDDMANAAKYFDLAANTNGVPDGIKKFSASYGSRGDRRQKAIDLWTNIFESSNDQSVKERAGKYVYHYELLNFLDTAAIEYKNKFGKFPAETNDLVNSRLLKEIPIDPFGFEFRYSDDGKVVLK